jgi:hypothetical protein
MPTADRSVAAVAQPVPVRETIGQDALGGFAAELVIGADPDEL